ncbi:hypothetical protein FIV42_05080 [Persicimonas caeni]|uniref:non-specific serine/threonine protein kinase n=1 Tax=Persicimonas caeni TaxID=2292766 RepID=A0A4Y6PP73_PERCE|nr:RCC1 domain-containing protein [Persicimonas caeni]QDG50128.1 hypothetical protein FIV42_05080 [Persicimonas caeni]QED31349.1 hypothetical protein FRD00_05075 [Persicimonas caeni]
MKARSIATVATVALASLVSLTFSASCTDDHDPKTGSESHWLSCNTTSDCPSEHTCISGQCRPNDGVDSLDATDGVAQDVTRQPGDVWAEVDTPQGLAVLDVDVTGSWFCVLQSDGSVGCNENLDGPDGSFKAISTGFWHACAIRDDDTLACWGMGEDPNVDENADNDFDQAVAPTGTYLDVAAGWHHTCAIDTAGVVSCWGRNDEGQATPPSGTFTDLSAGGKHTCGLRDDNTIECWGAGSDPSLDDRINHGQAVPPAGSFASLDAGRYHTCALRDDGTTECWGLGSEPNSQTEWEVPDDGGSGISGDVDQAIPPAVPFTQISAGTQTSCAVDEVGAIWCWGWNYSGWPSKAQFRKVSTGIVACGIRTNDTLLCWRWAPRH